MVGCAACGARHHRACFLEHGRCTVYGCGSRELSEDPGDDPRRGWRLHPFLPRGAFAGQRPAQFVFVKAEERPARGPIRGPSLRLRLPTQASCGRELEGRVDLRLPGPTDVWGVRLDLRALVDARGHDQELFHEEAVLLGRPRRGWLERLGLSGTEAAPLRLEGHQRLSFALDPGRLHRAEALPQDPSFGPWHVLELRAVLEGESLQLATRRHRLLISHDHARCLGAPGR